MTATVINTGTVSLDKASYVAGDKLTATIHGFTATVTTAGPVQTLTLNMQASDGTPETYKGSVAKDIPTTAPMKVVSGDLNGVPVTVAADGQSVTVTVS